MRPCVDSPRVVPAETRGGRVSAPARRSTAALQVARRATTPERGASMASFAGGGRLSVEALEEERDFCLRSLRDLEAEHAAGDLDDADYETLRESYVARAAVAIRGLDPGTSEVATGSAGGGGSAAHGLETA